MLHVVQVVMWGAAERPQLFVDGAEARSAYVASVRRSWGQRYAAYCEHHGLCGDDLASAEAFVKTIDVSEKSGINYWTFDRYETGLGGTAGLQKAAGELAAVKEGLVRLLGAVSGLADSFARGDVPVAEALPAAAPEKATPSSPSAPREETEAGPERYGTDEWKRFAGSIARLCGGARNEFPLLPRDEWRRDVYGRRTSLEYLDWVADRVERYREKGECVGYSVVEEPDTPGWYRFADREGTCSEERYGSEWEAWCAAGLHSEEVLRRAAG